MSNLSLDPEGGQRTGGEEGDDEDIDTRSESLRKLARVKSIWVFFFVCVCKINCVKLTKSEQETRLCMINNSGIGGLDVCLSIFYFEKFLKSLKVLSMSLLSICNLKTAVFPVQCTSGASFIYSGVIIMLACSV